MGVNVMPVGMESGAAFWDQFVAVCTAAAGVGAGRKALAGLLGAAGAAVPSEVAERLAPLVQARAATPAADGGWLSLMVRSGKAGECEVRAAQEIAYVLRLRADVCSAAIPALDPGRLVVDGGPNPGARVYGLAMEPAVERYDAWVAKVRALPVKQRVVRGRNEDRSLLGLVQRVLAHGDGPRQLDQTLGVRNGRCGEAVLRELKRYADCHFRS